MNLVDWLWTLLVFFFMVMYFILLFRIIVDIFRSDDLSGWAKAGWLIFLFVLTLLAALIYVIARGKGMTERDMAQYKQVEAAQADYIRSVAATPARPGRADQERARPPHLGCHLPGGVRRDQGQGARVLT